MVEQTAKATVKQIVLAMCIVNVLTWIWLCGEMSPSIHLIESITILILI